jgi:hypothetical protein
VDVLPEAGTFIALHHVRGRDVADDTVYTAVLRDGRLDVGDEVD